MTNKTQIYKGINNIKNKLPLLGLSSVVLANKGAIRTCIQCL